MTEGALKSERIDCPVRQKSARGHPRPETSITRCCKTCGACFIGLAPGKTGERGIWRDWRWYCSAECDPESAPKENTGTMTDRFADVRANTREATARLAAIHRQPWRLVRNRRLRREARALLAEGDAMLDEIAPLPSPAEWRHIVERLTP